LIDPGDLARPGPSAPEASNQTPARSLRASFPFVVATMVCVHACMAATRVASSLLVLKSGYPEWTVGVLLSLYAVAPLALSMWAGRLADRHGFHRPVGWAVGMACVGALAAVLSQHVLALALAGLLTGGAVSVAGVTIQREAGLMAQNSGDLKRVFSWMALGPALSNALTPVAAGLLIDLVSFRAAFVLALLLGPLAWWLALKVPRLATAAHGNAANAASQRAWDLLRSPALRRLLMINIVLSSCWDAHSFVVPVVGHARGMSASGIGLLLGAFAVAATLVRLAITRWADKLDEIKVLRSAMALATLVLLAYAWLPGSWGLMLGSGVLGLALGSVQPMILATLHQVTPADRHGQALGLRMLLTNAATIVMPLSFGLLAAASATAAPMWLMAGLLIAAQWPARALRRDAASS
jgi:MFS family permease